MFSSSEGTRQGTSLRRKDKFESWLANRPFPLAAVSSIPLFGIAAPELSWPNTD